MKLKLRLSIVRVKAECCSVHQKDELIAFKTGNLAGLALAVVDLNVLYSIMSTNEL